MWTTEWEYRFGIHYILRKVIALRILLTVPKYAVNPAKFILEMGLLGQLEVTTRYNSSRPSAFCY